MAKLYEDLNDSHEEDEPLEREERPADPRLREHIERFKTKHSARGIFIVKGDYSDLARSLESLGWVENPETDSRIFDLKFLTRRKEI